MAELLELRKRLGGIPAYRIRLKPPPGTATEQDVLAERDSPQRRLCELVDGVLVEKAMATMESAVGAEVIRLLGNHVRPRNLGVVLAADGMLRILPGQVRIPDVTFIPWDRIPGRRLGKHRIEPLVPDLAVEVLSEGNTPAEIRRKLREYFLAGTRLAWVIDPRKQTARIYTAPDESRRVSRKGNLDGSPVLPGFILSLPELFSCIQDQDNPSS